jgi:hypothetical protein
VAVKKIFIQGGIKMVDENKAKETVEKIDDAIEDVVEDLEDLGLLTQGKADWVLHKVKLYKKYILLAIPVAVAIVVMIQSL